MLSIGRKTNFLFISLSFIALLLFALYFYFERLNSDAGYYFFHTINQKSFHLEHGRLVLALSELLPLLGLYLNLPLKILAVLYSINHVLFFGTLAFTCYYKFKHQNAAIFITLIQFAGIRYSAFTPQFELYYGLALLVFAFAFIAYLQEHQKTWNNKRYIILSILLMLIFTSHPMAVYCTFVGLTLFFLNRIHKSTWIISIIIFLLYIAWKKAFVSDYEQNKMKVFSDAINAEHLKHFFNWQFVVNVISFLFQYYLDAVLLFFIGLFLFIKNKQYKNLMIYAFGVKISLFIIWLMFQPDSLSRYIEQVYFPFVFLCGIWVFYFRLQTYKLLLISVIVIVRFGLMFQTGWRNEERTMQMAQFTDMAQREIGTQFFVTEKEMGPYWYAQGNWSYGFETLLYSAMHNKKTVTITKQEDLDYNNNWQLLKPNEFLFRPFDRMPIEELNTRYLKLNKGPYVLLKKN